MKLFKFDLNLSAVSWKILKTLDKKHPSQIFGQIKWSDIDVTTEAWYNGRERGIYLSFSYWKALEQLHVLFYEHRSSDVIYINHWIGDRFVNPPNPETINERGLWDKMHTTCFGHGHIKTSANHIIRCVHDYLELVTVVQPMMSS